MIMLRLVFFVLLTAPALLGAQRTEVSLQGQLGANLPILRNAVGLRFASDGLATAPGLTAGLEIGLAFTPDFGLGIGFDYLHHRGEMKGFRNEGRNFFRSSERIGNLILQENFVRLRLETQFYVQRVELNVGVQLTQNVGNRELLFNYNQITTQFTDLPSETVIELAEPIRTPGSTTLLNAQTTYMGLLFGLGYRLNDKLQVKARYDFGVHGGLFADEIRIGRHTLDLVAAYTIVGRGN